MTAPVTVPSPTLGLRCHFVAGLVIGLVTALALTMMQQRADRAMQDRLRRSLRCSPRPL
jgi:hypothetical protein